MGLEAVIKALRDTGQSASNAVASNVSGPVDLLALGLRKLGVPGQEKPFMGSQWMAERGLTRDVEMGAPRIIGETLGMAGPAVMASKAPQIANAANQAVTNAMAPRTMNPQTGAIVWHGSPHKFDKFDSSKIGTGEGAQAYGHGLYLAESPEVAKSYVPKSVGGGDIDEAALIRSMDTIKASLKKAETQGGFSPAVVKRLKTNLAELESSDLSKRGSSLYKVDLPDEQIAKMLDWDKPLSQQAPEVRAAVQKVVPPFNDDMVNVINKKIEDASLLARTATDAATKKAAAQEHARLLNSLRTRQPEIEGKGLMSYLGSPVQASAALREAGIPGIRYLDGGSRGTGSGTSNFVVFPGNEDILKILERNGQPLGLMGVK